MNFHRLILVSICILLSTGCGIHKNHKVYNTAKQDVNNYYQTINTNRNLCQKKSDSEQLIGQAKLDLSMSIDIACKNNPSVKRAWHFARAERARLQQIKSAYYPTVIINGTAERTEATTAVQKSVQKTLGNSIYPSIELHYSLFKFGGTKLSAEAAKYALYSANYQYDRTLQSVVHDIECAYLGLSLAEQTITAKEKNLEDANGAYESTYSRYKSGLANLQEYLQAKANKTQAEFELECTYANVESARAILAKTMGITVSESIKILHPVLQSDLQEISLSVDDLISEVIKTRPDIRAAYSQVISSKKLTKSTKTNLLPEFVLGGSGSKKKYEHISGTHNNFNVFAGLEWKIFDGFKNIYDIVEAKENTKIAQAEFEQAKLQAQSEVWTCYFAFKSAIKQLESARKVLESSQESFQSMLISYNNGLCKFTDLLTTQSSLANARLQLVNSEYNLLTAISNLAYSTGGIIGNELINK